MTTPPPDLLTSLQALDLTSADGRAGLSTALAEIERLSPGAILREAATIQLRRVGWATRPPVARADAAQTDAPALAVTAR